MPAQSFLEQAKANYRDLGLQNEVENAGEDEQPSSSGRETHTRQQQSQQQTRRRRRRQQASEGTGTLTLLALGGYLLWRWWRRRRESGGQSHSAGAQTGAQEGKARSPFTFDHGKKVLMKKGSKEALSAQSPVQAVPTVKAAPPPPNLSGPGPRVSGNPKKKHKGKNAKKDKKGAASQGGKDDPAAAIIAERAKQKGIAEAGKTPETGFYTTVDVEKNTDAYHNVKEWQETGKKTYKR